MNREASATDAVCCATAQEIADAARAEMLAEHLGILRGLAESIGERIDESSSSEKACGLTEALGMVWSAMADMRESAAVGKPEPDSWREIAGDGGHWTPSADGDGRWIKWIPDLGETGTVPIIEIQPARIRVVQGQVTARDLGMLTDALL